MTLLEIINKHQLSSAHIARKIGISRSSFNNKLKGNNDCKFTGPEMERIYEVLDEMDKDLRKLLTKE